MDIKPPFPPIESPVDKSVYACLRVTGTGWAVRTVDNQTALYLRDEADVKDEKFLQQIPGTKVTWKHPDDTQPMEVLGSLLYPYDSDDGNLWAVARLYSRERLKSLCIDIIEHPEAFSTSPVTQRLECIVTPDIRVEKEFILKSLALCPAGSGFWDDKCGLGVYADKKEEINYTVSQVSDTKEENMPEEKNVEEKAKETPPAAKTEPPAVKTEPPAAPATPPAGETAAVVPPAAVEEHATEQKYTLEELMKLMTMAKSLLGGMEQKENALQTPPVKDSYDATKESAGSTMKIADTLVSDMKRFESLSSEETQVIGDTLRKIDLTLYRNNITQQPKYHTGLSLPVYYKEVRDMLKESLPPEYQGEKYKWGVNVVADCLILEKASNNLLQTPAKRTSVTWTRKDEDGFTVHHGELQQSVNKTLGKYWKGILSTPSNV